ncbi:MAG: phosphatidate cytidylyltransferase, partial [Armatimonadetes bacterium]|nr:phosphatidate cytidylyltransferase [Armatimonadota bacterium]
MLIKRIISGFFLIFISILLIFLGKLPFTFEIAFISLLGVLELYNLFSLKGFNSFKLYGSISTLLIVFCASLKPDFLFNLLLILFLANIVIVTVNKIRSISSVIDLGITYLGYLYIGWLFSYLILVRDISDYFLIFNF